MRAPPSHHSSLSSFSLLLALLLLLLLRAAARPSFDERRSDQLVMSSSSATTPPPVRSSTWDGSEVHDDHIEFLRKTRWLPGEDHVRVRLALRGEISPAPQEGERVIFRSHCLRGLCRISGSGRPLRFEH